MTKPILVIGSANQDLIISLPHLPGPGETVIGGNYQTAFGGKGANQAVAAARAGGKVILMSKLGEDEAARRMLGQWEKDGLDVSSVLRDRKEPTGAAFIFVDHNGENCIGVASGANANLSPQDIQDSAAVIQCAGCLLLQMEIPMDTVKAAAGLAAEYGTPVILNPAPAGPIPSEILRDIDILTPNLSEAGKLTGLSLHDPESIERAAGLLLDMGVKSVIITLGSRGVYMAGQGLTSRRFLPAFEVEVRDTTAAGDVFNGALAAALSGGRSLARAAEFGAAAAAMSVTRMGAQISAPRLKDIELFLRKRGPGFFRT
jgi:ribokinase